MSIDDHNFVIGCLFEEFLGSLESSWGALHFLGMSWARLPLGTMRLVGSSSHESVLPNPVTSKSHGVPIGAQLFLEANPAQWSWHVDLP
jgi:hypothetical protein